jgi:hypothetical protein
LSKCNGGSNSIVTKLIAKLFQVLALLGLMACGGAVTAQSDEQAEYRVKAAFVYKFGEYIQWPDDSFASAKSPITVGVIGADKLVDELMRITSGRSVGGREIAVRKLRPGDPVSDLHLLFVGRAGADRVADLLSGLKGRAVLTVTESDRAFSLGSMINFVVVDDKVRFDIALRPVEEGNIKISSRLLTVARKVLPRAA